MKMAECSNEMQLKGAVNRFSNLCSFMKDEVGKLYRKYFVANQPRYQLMDVPVDASLMFLKGHFIIYNFIS